MTRQRLAGTSKVRRQTGRGLATMIDSFSTAEIARLTGLSPRQVDHWTRVGLIQPSVHSATGSGSQRRWSYRDVLTTKIAAKLRSAGFDLDAIGDALGYLRTHLADISTGLAISESGEVLAIDDGGDIVSLTRRGQLVLSLAIEPIADGLDADIATMPRADHDDRDTVERLTGQMRLGA